MGNTDITYTTRNGETFDGYLSIPKAAGPHPGILLITAIFGVDDEMKALSDAWAADGFVVSVPDIFWRVLPGPTADLKVAFDRMGKFDFDVGINDVEDLIADLRGRSECNGRVGILGYCFGGRYAHVAAARLGANAAGSFHGTLIENHLDEMPPLDCPISFHFGDNDAATPIETYEKIKAAYSGHRNAEIVLHTGDVQHNFAMPRKNGYNESVCKASREAVLRCFRSM